MFLTNTMTRRKEELVPVHEGEVRIYACGPTVYNYFHLGNARPFTLFDTLRRYLEYRGYRVVFVQNFTDIDDKMIARARQEGVTVAELAERFIGEYEKDAAALNIRPATVHPRATEHIPEIIALVQTLMDKGHAYLSKDGVYFDVQSYPSYIRLSGQSAEDLESGARIEVDENKRNPADFALWKLEKPGEPAWDSPFGRGRPGWHIECSAMSMKHLGETIDIHTGGQDLIFPHHENELAQSEAATGKPFVNIWLHNGFINIDNEKMSKSLGNVFTVRDLVEHFDPEVVRLFLLSAHYRSPINFYAELIESQSAALDRLYAARDRWAFMLESAPQGGDAAFAEKLEGFRTRFIDAMDDDLNTAGALGALFDLVREGNAFVDGAHGREDLEGALALLDELSGVLGLLYRRKGGNIPADVQALAQERADARKAKDWKRSDALRDALRGMGWSVEDTPQGQKLGRA